MHNRIRDRIIALRFAGYSYAEIGHALEIYVEAVWDVLHEARETAIVIDGEPKERKEHGQPNERPKNILACAMHWADLEREYGRV